MLGSYMAFLYGKMFILLFQKCNNISKIASETFVDAKHVFTGQYEKTALPDFRSSKTGKPLIVVFFLNFTCINGRKGQ